MADEDEEITPETLKEAGALEADIGARFDTQLSSIDPRQSIGTDPWIKKELRPEMMVIRDELRQAKWQTLAVRRSLLKKVLIKDFIKEDHELRKCGIAYASPEPY